MTVHCRLATRRPPTLDIMGGGVEAFESLLALAEAGNDGGTRASSRKGEGCAGHGKGRTSRAGGIGGRGKAGSAAQLAAQHMAELADIDERLKATQVGWSFPSVFYRFITAYRVLKEV